MKQININFIGVGTYKSGTTWIVQCLREHPDVCIPHLKELEFFNTEYDENGNKMYSNYDKGFGWYAAQFVGCDQNKLLGEFSNAYFDDKDAYLLIKKHYPNIKVLICLRNPVDRAYSDYWWVKLNFSKSKDNKYESEEFLDQSMIHNLNSFYYENLKKYIDTFGKDKVHVVIYEDIKTKPQEVIDKIVHFLNIPKYAPKSLTKIVNPASTSKVKALEIVFTLRRNIERRNMGFLIDVLKRMRLYNMLQKLYVKVNRQRFEYPKLSIEEREKSKNLFIKDIEKTEKLLGLDLSIWK